MSDLKNNITKQCPSPSASHVHLQEANERPEHAPPQMQVARSISEERFRSLVMAIEHIVWITDAQGRVIEAPDWLAFTGQSRADADAGNWLAYIHPEDQARVASAWNHSVVSHSRFDTEYRLRKQDGTYEHFEVHGVPLLNADGSIREWVGTSSNITARKQAEATVAMLSERLRRSLLEMDHRVKNNLQLISALAETQATDNSKATLQRIRQHAHALVSLHDFLAGAAKESGAATNTISIHAILDQLMPLLQARAGQRRIRYQAEEILSPIQQIASLAILVNELVVNAVQHGEGDIELTLHGKGNRVRLEVCDDGPGFPPDFDPRQAAKTGLELVHSTGCYDLRGEIIFENRPEGGARVIVDFPVPQQAV